MEQNNQLPTSSTTANVAYTLVSFIVFLVVHLILTFLFWLCINPVFKAFEIEAIGFGVAFGIWSAWMMVILVPAVIVLNLVKSMWPDKNNDLLLKLFSMPPVAVKDKDGM